MNSFYTTPGGNNKQYYSDRVINRNKTSRFSSQEIQVQGVNCLHTVTAFTLVNKLLSSEAVVSTPICFRYLVQATLSMAKHVFNGFFEI